MALAHIYLHMLFSIEDDGIDLLLYHSLDVQCLINQSVQLQRDALNM
jgi:hypothetical protein